jgi:hypothetical protein
MAQRPTMKLSVICSHCAPQEDSPSLRLGATLWHRCEGKLENSYFMVIFIIGEREVKGKEGTPG